MSRPSAKSKLFRAGLGMAPALALAVAVAVVAFAVLAQPAREPARLVAPNPRPALLDRPYRQLAAPPPASASH